MTYSNQEIAAWFKIQVLHKAIFSALAFFILIFVGLLWFAYPLGWDWRGYCGFAIGAGIGILITYRRIPNPYPLVTNRRDVLKMKLTQDEALEFLKPYWRTFPRYSRWIIGGFLAFLLWGITNLLGNHGEYTKVVLFLALLCGFGTCILICDIIFYVYVFRLLDSKDTR